jgi:hypothetical protein
MTILLGTQLGINTTPPTGVTAAIWSDPTPVGTVSNGGAGSGVITGTGTLFSSQFNTGDTITVGGDTQTVIRVPNDTTMTTTPFAAAFSGASYTFGSAPTPRFQVLDNGDISSSPNSFAHLIMSPQVTVNNGNTTTGIALATFSPDLTFAGSGLSRVQGARADVRIARTTTAPNDVTGAGVFGTFNVAAANTKDWPLTTSVMPCGVFAAVSGDAGATGTIARMAGVVASADATTGSSLNFTKLFGYVMNGVKASNLTNGVGAGIYDVEGSNRTYIALSQTVAAAPSGNWAIYDETGYDTRLSGAVKIGAGSDLVIDANAILYQYGVALPKNNNAAGAAPTVNDDSTADYSVGSVWFWPATGRIWKLRDATAAAAQWVEIALADEQGYIPGNWYMAPDMSVAEGTPPSADAIQLVPLVISARVTLSTLGARIVTAEHGGNLQLALYANDPATGRPTGNAVAATGSISTASTGVVSNAIAGGNVTIEPGLYWAGFNLDAIAGGMVALQVPSPSNHPTAALIGTASQANLGGSGDDDLVSLYVAQSFGTWPDLTSATFVEGSTPSRNGPAIHFKVA